jgi:hypothetical protein
MDKTFADRVHAAAAAIAGGMMADSNVVSYDKNAVARDAINLVLAVDAAIAAHQPAPQPEPTADALREAYERGLADGRTNPWRAASEQRNCAAVAFYHDVTWRSELCAPMSPLRDGAVWVPFPIAVPSANR